MAQGAAARYLVPSDGSLGTTWTAPGFDDSAWVPAVTGIGFDESGALAPLIGTDIDPAMRDVNPGAYLRVPFTPPAELFPVDELRLDLRFDDGAVAYLNGTGVAASNAPPSPVWNDSAPSDDQGFTIDNFAAPEPSYQLVNLGGPEASIRDDAPGAETDAFVRLVYNGQNSNSNTIHFERAITGAPERLVAEFDFRMNGAADGFSFLLLPTSIYGTDTSDAPAQPGVAEEPDVGATFAVGFDIWQNIDEISLRSDRHPRGRSRCHCPLHARRHGARRGIPRLYRAAHPFGLGHPPRPRFRRWPGARSGQQRRVPPHRQQRPDVHLGSARRPHRQLQRRHPPVPMWRGRSKMLPIDSLLAKEYQRLGSSL